MALADERHWTSAYSGLEVVARWKADFARCGYEVVGEFDLGKDWALFRFGPVSELDLAVFYNVEILTVKLPEPEVNKKESRWA